jgi:hypothetical protein
LEHATEQLQHPLSLRIVSTEIERWIY